jgi:hypothetical protein
MRLLKESKGTNNYKTVHENFVAYYKIITIYMRNANNAYLIHPLSNYELTMISNYCRFDAMCIYDR